MQVNYSEPRRLVYHQIIWEYSTISRQIIHSFEVDTYYCWVYWNLENNYILNDYIWNYYITKHDYTHFNNTNQKANSGDMYVNLT